MRSLNVAAAAAIAAAALCGCKSPHDLKEGAIARATANCTAEGKRFILKDVSITSSMNIGTATANGVCVGPDDPRYNSPEAHGG